MKVIEIVKAHLVAGGFDGLVCGAAECGCELAELAPCCGDISECEPAYRHTVGDPEAGDWIMSTSKTPPETES